MTIIRPEPLFPLFAEITGLPGVGTRIAGLLARMGIARPRDLVLTLPPSGVTRRAVETVHGVAPGTTVIVEVMVERHRPAATRSQPHRVQVRDAATAFQLVFFHADRSWLSRVLPEGARRVISGKVEHFESHAQIAHPDHIAPPGEPPPPAFEPVYPLTAGLAGKTMRKIALAAVERAPALPEWIDPALVRERGWPDWQSAVRRAHAPASEAEIAPAAPARARLAYDELLAYQLSLALARQTTRRSGGRASVATGRLQAQVRAALPFQPTGAQDRALREILADMAAEDRMNRLLQGDVGSGKTLVAFFAMLAAVEAGGQAALMAPTEVLARQHAAGLAAWAEAACVRLAILTGRDRGAERAATLAALAAGEIDVLVGTHALFQADVAFADLRLAIVDEQHRFGVRQRMELGAKGRAADILVMTATPIPRSLALAQYGDMDVSILDEKPPGRKPVETAMISAARLDAVVERLAVALAEGQQAYWVCPLVEESEVSDMSAAAARHRALSGALSVPVGLVHGQLPPAEKDAAMAAFKAGETRLLVATTVIEVGVDVPNASIMVIEQAERFGLAQLHQLRGRVGRGSAASTCLLLYTPPLGQAAKARLSAIRDTEDGFRIAEEDLRIRGMGDVIGVAQSGLPRFRVADLERQADLMATAQRDARAHLARDPALSSERGEALRLLLHLMEAEKAIGLLHVG